MTEIKIITLLLVIHYIGFFIRKNKNSVLSCGLFGWIGSDPKLFNKDKFDKLGIQNETRGTHSCGVSTDGNVSLGTYNTKEYRDFIAIDPYPIPTKIPVVIGHTRHATGGQHNEDNAHPFKFQNEKGFTIGAHNGVIKNYEELAKEYGINCIGKIDSEVLLEILHNDNIDVLSKYYGAAAILIYSTVHPNSLWVFKGESKKSHYTQTTEEERPLFFYQESENSMYISSLSNSLRSITSSKEDSEKNVKDFRTNTLYKITNGTIENRWVIDRSEMNQTAKPYRHDVQSKKETEEVVISNINKKTETEKETDSDNTSSVKRNPNTIHNYKLNNIFYEKAIFTDVEQEIFYENTMFKDSNGLITGICILTKEIGFIKICKKVNDVKGILKNFSYKDVSSNIAIEFGDIRDVTLFYIYEGVLLKLELDYTSCLTHLSNYETKKVGFEKLNFMSMYPIIDYDRLNSEEKIYPDQQYIMLNGKYANGLFAPIGSNKTYSYDLGKLLATTRRDKINIPDNTIKSLSLYDDGEFKDIIESLDSDNDDADDTSFEDVLTEQLNIDDINNKLNIITELKDDLNLVFQHIILELDSIDNSDSLLLNTFNDFVTDAQKRFKSISKMIDETNKNLKTV